MSEILGRLEPAGKFANSMASARYGIASTAKINVKEFRDTITTSYLAGMIAVSEAVAMMHKEDPYKNIDEMIGDLQLILHNSHTQLSKVHWQKIKPVSFSKILSDTTDIRPSMIS